MAWLFEDVTTVLTAGVLIEVLLAVVLFQTGRGVILAVMGGVFAVVVLLLAVEFAVVTPTEEVHATLFDAAAAAEADDVERFMSFIAPAARERFSEPRAWIPRFDIKRVRLGQLAVDVVDTGNSDQAVARFIASVTAQDRESKIPRDKFIARFRIDLQRIDNRWLMTGYQEETLRDSGAD